MEVKELMTKDGYQKCLMKTGLCARLELSPDENFLVEVAFLNWWNRSRWNEPVELGIEKIYKDDEYTDPTLHLIFDTVGDGDEEDFEDVIISYTPDPTRPGRHGLQILLGVSVFYDRNSSQDPATEWNINGMAGDSDVTDRDGHMLFPGDHTNI